MATLYAGTSGWSYPAWKPQFYPAKTPSNKFLQYYATRLNSVELNYTFRRFATEKLQRGWIESTPAHFVFSVKAHQMITHIKRLQDAAEITRSFLASLQLLQEAGRLGIVLFQLPPFQKADVELLGNFLKSLPSGLRKSFEFRHESWFDEKVFEVLRASDAALCLAESEKLTVPEVQTASYTYYRLRMPKYTPAEIKALSEKFAALRNEGKDIFCYFKHEETPDGALYAEELLKGSAVPAA